MGREILFDRKTGKFLGAPSDKNKSTELDDKVVVPEKKQYNSSKKILYDEPAKWKEEKVQKTRSEKVIEYFGSHELISVKGVCDAAKIDTSNFNKLLKAAKIIPDKLLDKIEPIIKKYGYV